MSQNAKTGRIPSQTVPKLVISNRISYESHMTKTLHIHDRFGTHPSDGESACAFRVSEIEPILSATESIEIDFSEVRIANSGFVNALIAGLFEQHGPDLLKKLVFRGCLPTVQVLVQSAIDLGLIKHQERLAQSY